jgi:S1-C subfamily serine protease
MQPFARFILGGAHSSLGASVSNLSVSASVNSFFIAPGGGVDIRITHNLWFRVGADWLHTSKDGVTVNGVRALAGIKFTFGGTRPSSASPRSQAPEPVSTAVRMKIGALGIGAAVGEQQGAEIVEVFPNGVAALAALHPGDVINAVDGKAVKTPMELAAELSSRKAGDKVRLGFSIREQWQSETVVTLGESQ